MTPLAWFVLGLVLGAFLVLIGSAVALGVAVAKLVRASWARPTRDNAARGGRVTVGEP